VTRKHRGSLQTCGGRGVSAPREKLAGNGGQTGTGPTQTRVLARAQARQAAKADRRAQGLVGFVPPVWPETVAQVGILTQDGRRSGSAAALELAGVVCRPEHTAGDEALRCHDGPHGPETREVKAWRSDPRHALGKSRQRSGERSSNGRQCGILGAEGGCQGVLSHRKDRGACKPGTRPDDIGPASESGVVKSANGSGIRKGKAVGWELVKARENRIRPD
jgi:hypothetical protein